MSPLRGSGVGAVLVPGAHAQYMPPLRGWFFGGGLDSWGPRPGSIDVAPAGLGVFICFELEAEDKFETFVQDSCEPFW